MRKGSKIISLIIVILLIGGSFTVGIIGYRAEGGYKKTIVYLGDSICEGILGSSPFSERDSYCYFAIVGRRNNFRYVDKSVSGDTTSNMYNRLVKTDTASLERQYWVTQADIIHISILGNDLLGGNIGQTAIEALSDDYTRINRMLSNAAHYFSLSIKRIKELNPDALIMVNTVYNPLDAATTLLTQSQKDALLELADGDQSQFRWVGGLLLQGLNSVIYDYLKNNPGAFEVIDVYTAFDNLYKEDYNEGIRLIYGDWLHPSNEGHAVIANLIQLKLEELGISNKSEAVSKYKVLRNQQLDRLFADTEINIPSIKKAISSAKSCQEISKIYFKAIRGVTPVYTNKTIKRRRGEIFEQTKTFKLTSIVMGADDFSSVADKNKSCITYRSDGTFSIILYPDSIMLSLLNVALFVETKNGGIKVSDYLGSPGFGTELEVYLREVFPGFDLRYIKKSIELLSSVGLSINGLDYESNEMKALLTSMEENLIIPHGFVIPSQISFEVKGYYFIEKAGDFTNIHMCVGNVSRNGYPFLYATLHTDNDGEQWIETSIEVSKITLTAGK